MGHRRKLALALAIVAPSLVVTAAAAPDKGEDMQKKFERYCAKTKAPTGERFAEKLRGRLDLRDNQKPALKDLQDAFAKSMADGKAALCSTKPDFATTLGRFALAKNRAEIRFERMKALEPKLTAFYNALDDKQKASLDEMRLWAPKKRVNKSTDESGKDSENDNDSDQ